MKRLVLIATLVVVFATTASAQMIGPTNSKQTETRTESSSLRPTGPFFMIEAPAPCSIGLGYQITPYFMAGLGVGWYFIPSGSDGPQAFYAETRVSTPLFKNAIFLDGRLGYDYLGGAFGSIAAGFMYKYFSISGGIAAGADDLGIVASISYAIPLNIKLF